VERVQLERLLVLVLVVMVAMVVRPLLLVHL
jgi:hypothetical protein